MKDALIFVRQRLVQYMQNHPVEKTLKDALQNRDLRICALWSPKESGSYVKNLGIRLNLGSPEPWLDTER